LPSGNGSCAPFPGAKSLTAGFETSWQVAHISLFLWKGDAIA